MSTGTVFKRASKSRSRLRMALVGPSGSGKTYTALALATELARLLGRGRVALIDTERGSAAKYAPPTYRSDTPRPGEFLFDSIDLGSYDPRNYIEVIQAAQSEGYDVLVIDSLTHAWSGKGGALELVDHAAKRSKSNNSYTAWRDVTPLHNALVDAIIGSGCHVIATMRTKTDYVLEADPNTGKMSPRKIGLAPVQREGMDYEFDIVADLDLDHNLMVGKTRCRALDGYVVNKPGKPLAEMIANWLSDASPVAIANGPATQSNELPADIQDRLLDLVHRTKMTNQQVLAALAKRGVAEIKHLSTIDAQDLINKLEGIASREEFLGQFGPAENVAQSDGATVANSPANNDSTGDPDNHVIPDATRVPRGDDAD